MDKFDAAYKKAFNALEDLRVFTHNQIKEGSMTATDFQTILECVEVCRQEAVTAVDALTSY